MGGKTKKKQARKQAATRTKSNGGRNGVSGHMKKSSIGNGKRAADAGDSASLASAKKNGKNTNNQKSTNMKRKRDEDEDDDAEGEGEGHDDDVRGSSMFTSVDDDDAELGSSKEPSSSKKEPSGRKSLPSSEAKGSTKKKQRLNESIGSASKPPVASNFRELVATKLSPLEDTSFSRLLYPNPVCFLTTINANNADGTEGGLNAMTLSWMTPLNNYGGFAFAIHKTRYSAANLLTSKKFTLSVPTAQSRDLVLAVGRVSGKVVKKFDGSIPNLKAGSFGLLGITPKAGADSSSKNRNGFDALFDSDDEEEEAKEASTESNNTAAVSSSSRVHHTFPPPIDGTVAHMNCSVLSHTDAADEGTYLVIAKINRAAVHPEYWSHKGKCFVTAGNERDAGSPGPVTVDAEAPVTRCLPPILSFLGSQRFGHLVSE